MLSKLLKAGQEVLPRICLRPFQNLYQHSERLRNRYWDRRAADIDAQWGNTQEDFGVLSEVLNALRPQRILDFGCGSGRLFPLYHKHAIAEVVGQDVSEKALAICRQRWLYPNITLVCKSVNEMAYPEQYFDLIISNRVLQHVPPAKIESVAAALARFGRTLYVNEMSESDYNGKFFFMFKHDYEKILSRLGFRTVKTGLIGSQRWILFSKSNDSETIHADGE